MEKRENGSGNEGEIEKIWRLWGAVVQIQSERNKQRRDDENLHDMQGNERKSEGKCTKLATDGASTGRNRIN